MFSETHCCWLKKNAVNRNWLKKAFDVNKNQITSLCVRGTFSHCIKRDKSIFISIRLICLGTTELKSICHIAEAAVVASTQSAPCALTKRKKPHCCVLCARRFTPDSIQQRAQIEGAILLKCNQKHNKLASWQRDGRTALITDSAQKWCWEQITS